MIRSAVKYFGAKGSNGMLPHIYSKFPIDWTNIKVYVEPFAGSFVVGLNNPYDVPIEIYNDLNNNVYSVFKVLSDPSLFAQFKELCDVTYFCEYIRSNFKEDIKSPDLDVVQRAYKWFIVNKFSFNGIGGFTSTKIIRRNMSKSVSDFLSSVDGLPALHQRLSKVIVYNRDAIKVIEDNNADNVFFYMDPPYAWETRGSTRYAVDFTPEQQTQLLDVITTSKAKILLSGYDNAEYEQRLVKDNGWNKYQFVVHTISGNKAKTPKNKVETLWYNYPLVEKNEGNLLF